MKSTIAKAILASIGTLIVVAISGTLFLAGLLTSDKVPAFGASNAVWDQFLITPIVFVITGAVFGYIAATDVDIKQTLAPAFVTATVIVVGVEWATHVLMQRLTAPLLQMDVKITADVWSSKEIGMTIAASVLWVAWFVVGAAVGHSIRRKLAAKAAG